MYLYLQPAVHNNIIAKHISRRVSFCRFMVYKILKRVDGGHLLLYTVILYIAFRLVYIINP